MHSPNLITICSTWNSHYCVLYKFIDEGKLEKQLIFLPFFKFWLFNEKTSILFMPPFIIQYIKCFTAQISINILSLQISFNFQLLLWYPSLSTLKIYLGLSVRHMIVWSKRLNTWWSFWSFANVWCFWLLFTHCHSNCLLNFVFGCRAA